MWRRSSRVPPIVWYYSEPNIRILRLRRLRWDDDYVGRVKSLIHSHYRWRTPTCFDDGRNIGTRTFKMCWKLGITMIPFPIQKESPNSDFFGSSLQHIAHPESMSFSPCRFLEFSRSPQSPSIEISTRRSDIGGDHHGSSSSSTMPITVVLFQPTWSPRCVDPMQANL